MLEGAGFRRASAGFPKGPYRLRPKFVGYRWLAIVGCGLGSLAALVTYLVMGWQGLSGIWHDAEIWEAGGPEVPADVGGRVTTRQLVLKSYRLDVAYVTPDGRAHRRKLELETLFGGMDQERERLVRFRSNEPDEFALNTAVEDSGGRYAAAAFFIIMGSIIAGVMGWIAWAVLKEWRRAAAAATQGTFMWADLLSREPLIINDKPSDVEMFTFRVSLPGQSPVDVQERQRTKDGVLTANGGRRVLALVPPNNPSRSILVLDSFYPLALDTAAAEQARAAISAAG